MTHVNIDLISCFQDVVRYRLHTLTDGGLDYFLLEEKTGKLILKKPLREALQEYRVRIEEWQQIIVKEYDSV